MFIDLFVGEIDLGAGRDDQGKLHSLPARPPRLKKDALQAGENQFAHRTPVCCRLRLQPAVERAGISTVVRMQSCFIEVIIPRVP